MNKKRKQMIILCGGKGKRMGKLTRSIPKPLIKVGKKQSWSIRLITIKPKKFKNLSFVLVTNIN